jgi:hypothetical protein
MVGATMTTMAGATTAGATLAGLVKTMVAQPHLELLVLQVRRHADTSTGTFPHHVHQTGEEYCSIMLWFFLHNMS